MSIAENDPLWFLKHNPRAYGEVKEWLEQKRQQQLNEKWNTEREVFLIDELLKDLSYAGDETKRTS